MWNGRFSVLSTKKKKRYPRPPKKKRGGRPSEGLVNRLPLPGPCCVLAIGEKEKKKHSRKKRKIREDDPLKGFPTPLPIGIPVDDRAEHVLLAALRLGLLSKRSFPLPVRDIDNPGEAKIAGTHIRV